MSIGWLHELDPGSYVLSPEDDPRTVLITAAALESVSDFIRSQPTIPSRGRIYRRNFGRGPEHEDDWWLYVCEDDPSRWGWVLYVPYKVELTDMYIGRHREGARSDAP